MEPAISSCGLSNKIPRLKSPLGVFLKESNLYWVRQIVYHALLSAFSLLGRTKMIPDLLSNTRVLMAHVEETLFGMEQVLLQGDITSLFRTCCPHESD